MDKQFKGKIIIKNKQRQKEFEKLNNYVNWTSNYYRSLYDKYCIKQDEIKNKIKEDNKDFEIEFIIEEIK